MNNGPDGRSIRDRIALALMLFGFALSYLLGLVIRYQIVSVLAGNTYVKPAFFQRQEGVPVSLARGRILDRDGIPLHSPYWNPVAAIFPGRISDEEDFVSQTTALTGIAETRIRAMLDTGTSPAKILREISPGKAQAIVAKSIPGLVVIPEETRYGPCSLARHVVGHIRPNAYINPKDNIGESGLERWFQAELVGGTPAWAGTLVAGDGQELPGAGVRIGSLRDYPKDLVTTIDASIQYSVEKILDEEGIQKGAVVVLHAASGEILAMASRPQYDQNRPEDYLHVAGGPFVNRAISDFTPGSVWKPVIMALALESGCVDHDEVFECHGHIAVGSNTVRCGLSESGHGIVTAREAIAKSCNSALIQIGLRIPAGRLIEWARTCGFGQETRIPLPNECAGVLPDSRFMFSGDLANYSIGQGYLTATPLQVAAFFRSIINGGKYSAPVLIPGSPVGERPILSASTCRFLEDALLLAALDGTAEAGWVPGFGCAGKTGTAEVEGTPPQSHAWFAGWCPIMAPEYVICVFVERFGDGPTLAAPLFSKIATQVLLCK